MKLQKLKDMIKLGRWVWDKMVGCSRLGCLESQVDSRGIVWGKRVVVVVMWVLLLNSGILKKLWGKLGGENV